LRISTCREMSVRRAFKYIICTPTSRSPARLIRYFFSMLDAPHTLSCPRVGHVPDEFFGGEEGTGGSETAAGVGASGGQPGSNAMEGYSVTIDHPCESRVSMGVRRVPTHARGGSQPDEQHGLAAGVLIIDHRWKNRYRGLWDNYFCTHHLLRSADSIRVFIKPLSNVPIYRHAALGSVYMLP
jgi:hypothetical protein